MNFFFIEQIEVQYVAPTSYERRYIEPGSRKDLSLTVYTLECTKCTRQRHVSSSPAA